MLSMKSRSPQWPVTIRRPQQVDDTTTHTPFSVDFKYPIVAQDSSFLAFSATPGVEPALPSHERRAHSTTAPTVAAKVKSGTRTPRKPSTKPRPKKISEFLCTAPDCGYKSTKLHGLRTHMLIHSDNANLKCNLGIREPNGQVRSCQYSCGSKSTMTRHRRGTDRHSPHAGDNERRILDITTHPDPPHMPELAESARAPMWTPVIVSDDESVASGESDVDELMSDDDSMAGSGSGPRASDFMAGGDWLNGANARSTVHDRNRASNDSGSAHGTMASGDSITDTGPSWNQRHGGGYRYSPGCESSRADPYSPCGGSKPSGGQKFANGPYWGHNYGYSSSSNSTYYPVVPSMPAYMLPVYGSLGPMVFPGLVGSQNAPYIPAAPYPYPIGGGTGPLRGEGPHGHVNTVGSDEMTESRTPQYRTRGYLSWEDMLNAPEDA